MKFLFVFYYLLITLLHLEYAAGANRYAKSRSKRKVVPPNGRFAQGNLAVIFDTNIGKTSDHHPLQQELSPLWCQATENGEDRLKIKYARFSHIVPPPLRVLDAQLSPERTRAFLNFGVVSPSAIGKYRCEITTDSDDFVFGNMFVYMRPILHVENNTNLRFEQAPDEKDSFSFIARSTHSIENDTVELNCPVLGYPIPGIEWLKDSIPINKSAVITGRKRRNSDEVFGPKYAIRGNKLIIIQVTKEDQGMYRCIARNSFAPVDGNMVEYQLVLEQFLRVSNSFAWLIPLAAIILMLILLFIIIYFCSWWNSNRSKEYNVAQKERQMGRTGERQRLNHEQEEKH